ncbi:MAG: hypothetical protein PVI90_02590 [Desulfobacteraceae bacterium]
MITPIEINSGLTTICMLDAISSWDDKKIIGQRCFHKAPSFAVIEACAQLCAFHVRKLRSFACHAFLLSISAFAPLPPSQLNGLGCFNAHVKSVSQKAYAYGLNVRLEDSVSFKVSLTIGITEFGEKFKADILRDHYRQLFESLYKLGLSEFSGTCREKIR